MSGYAEAPKAESAETGDTANSVLFAAAAILSAVSACAAFILNRKRM